MAQEALTERQQKVFQFLHDYIQRRGFPPTLREIGDGVGIANLTAVRGHLSAIEKKGWILKLPDKARSIRILEGARTEPSALSRFKRALHKVLRTDEGVAYHIVYGIAWVTVGQEVLLSEKAAGEVAAAMEKEAVERGWTLYEKKVESNRVTVVVGAWPNHSPDKVARRFQQATREAVISSLELAATSKVWANGYAVTTEIDTLEEMVEELEGN